jgi:hypothetical protein
MLTFGAAKVDGLQKRNYWGGDGAHQILQASERRSTEHAHSFALAEIYLTLVQVIML